VLKRDGALFKMFLNRDGLLDFLMIGFLGLNDCGF